MIMQSILFYTVETFDQHKAKDSSLSSDIGTIQWFENEIHKKHCPSSWNYRNYSINFISLFCQSRVFQKLKNRTDALSSICLDCNWCEIYHVQLPKNLANVFEKLQNFSNFTECHPWRIDTMPWSWNDSRHCVLWIQGGHPWVVTMGPFTIFNTVSCLFRINCGLE